VLDWTSTISLTSRTVWPFSSTVNPASWMIRSAVRDPPTLAEFWSICFVPVMLPRANETITNASQPRIAVLR